MWYVNIEGIGDSYLGFLGFTLVSEDDEFKFYRGYNGSEHVVRKAQPRLYVDDVNDVAILNGARMGQVPEVFRAPPIQAGPALAPPSRTQAQHVIPQAVRFVDAARKAGASEDEADFDKALRQVAKAKPSGDSKAKNGAPKPGK